MPQFIIFSLSHQRASIQKRESFSFTKEEITIFSKLIKSRLGEMECLILSTCNRTEILTHMEQTQVALFFKVLAEFKQQPLSQTKSAFEVYLDEEKAMLYFGEVSAGLQSQILGDAQILNQLKQAYHHATAQGLVSTYIHRLIHSLFAANKKIANQTNFKSGISSVSFAAVDMASEYLEMIKDPKICLVGFGEMGRNVCKHLLSKGYRNICILNRSREKVEQFALQHGQGITFLPVSSVVNHLSHFDVIIAAPSVDGYLIKPDCFLEPVANFKLLIDISLPRSIDPKVDQIKGIIRLDIDDIRQVTDTTMAQKEASIEAVKIILKEHLSDFQSWMVQYKKLGIIKELKSYLHKSKSEEIARLKKQNDIESALHQEASMEAMIQKVIKRSVVALKSARNEQERMVYVNLISEMFLN
ncbi:glutamyl-tRNA reductase [Pararhodonellum marinum]|uniref:glutamyl-tRNA reductase n=1 Tax=Pararhodonellum marinum TaxID=2755358 RepID=UPI00188F5AF6|nr:glutamyl-tRNA reductase [Pararhodonellum marinum]